jgi:hypothetical protein
VLSEVPVLVAQNQESGTSVPVGFDQKPGNRTGLTSIPSGAVKLDEQLGHILMVIYGHWGG